MKDIGVLGWELPPFFSGGLGIHTYNLFSALSSSLNLTLYIPKFSENKLNYPFKVVMVDYNPMGSPYNRNNDFYYNVMEYNEVLKTSVSPSHEIYHIHDWITVPAGIYLKYKYGKKLVMTVHSTEYDRSGGFNPQPRILKLEKEGMIAADKIIAVSHYTKDIIVRNFGIDPGKIQVIHNGVKSQIYSMYNRTYDLKKKILYFGRVTPQKGAKFFLEIAAKVSEYMNDLNFIVAGTGDQLNELQSFARTKDLKNVIFHGFVSDSEAIKFYISSDVFILPAVSEPFGMTVIEAMSSGTPVIISKTTGVGEALGNVLKADFWDTDKMSSYVMALAKYQKLRETMGILGKVEASRFTWENAALKTLEVYASL